MRTHKTRRQSKVLYCHVQIRLTSHLWIIFLMLIISILPNSCCGVFANAHPRSNIHPQPNPGSYKPRPSHFHLFVQPLPMQAITTITSPPPLPQVFRHGPKRRSKASSKHVSKLPLMALTPTVRMGRSGSGTCQASPT